MELENVLSVGLAVCLLFALGASSNALGEAMSTDPDEVIDVDYASLPFSEDDAGELRDAVTGENGDAASREEGTSGPRIVSGDGDQSQASDRDGDPSDQSAPMAGSGDESQENPLDQGGDLPDQAGADRDADGQQPSPGEEGEQGSQPSDQQPSLLDRLLALLGQLLPFVLLLAGLALLYVFRRRLRELLGGGGGEHVERSESVTYVADPEDEVSAAWYEMVSTLGLDQDVSKTPRECERVARESGADPSLVRTLTDLYEQVRYAGEPVTEERSRRARETVEQFKRQHGGRA